MLKLSIPTPCHEDWNKMTDNQQGRHCNSCMKTVVDFTNMSDEEVQNFFINKKEERVCGRFNQQQLHRIEIELPSNIFQIQMPYWKQFLVASLIVFSTSLFSCEVKPVGKTSYEMQKTPEDTIDELTMTVGMIALPVDTSTKTLMGDTTIPVPKRNEKILQGEPLMGDIDISSTIDTVPVCKTKNPEAIITVAGMVSKRITRDTIPKKTTNEIIKGEIQFIPDSTKKNNECPSGI